MGAYGTMAGKGIEGIAGLLGKGKEAISGIAGSVDRAMNPGDFVEKLPDGIAGPPRKFSEQEVAMKKAGKQAAADKSMKGMASAVNLANAAGNPGTSYMDMGGLLGLGRQQMDDAQSRAQNLAGNSKAQIYQKMLFNQMMRGG